MAKVTATKIWKTGMSSVMSWYPYGKMLRPAYSVEPLWGAGYRVLKFNAGGAVVVVQANAKNENSAKAAAELDFLQNHPEELTY